jgi:tetratricopeptide (TPR) repeat protein
MSDEMEAHLKAGAKARGEGRLGAATKHYALALTAARGNREKLCIAYIARHLGDIHRENGQSDEAKSLLQESLDIYRRSLDTKVLDLANVLRPLALLHGSLGDHHSAHEFWQEAKVLYSAIRIVDGVTECDLHLGAGRS